MRRSFVPVEELAEAPYSDILGYPRATRRQLVCRVGQLQRLGVASVSFEGSVGLGGLSVLGKGYVGIVVRARTKVGTDAALKIRRMDSQRESMWREAHMLKVANGVDVGPVLYVYNRNFLVMEFLEGERVRGWVHGLAGRGSVVAFKNAARHILEDCFRLDGVGLDHGELSVISEHVVITEHGATIVDFDSASVHRRAANVTSAAQGIFIGSAISRRVRRLYRLPPQEEIIGALRRYKREPTRKSFDSLLFVLKL